MKRMTSAMYLVFALPCLLSSSPVTGAEPAKPNILLILADDMGFSDVGCFGGEIPTPHLDQLAARGMRFTQMYNTSKCFPSRACLLTGAYAQQVNMARGPGAIQNAVTLGEVLRGAGYRTLMTGKHHGTQNPFDRGFDRYFGLRDGACNYFNPGMQRPGEPKPAQKRPNRAWCIDGELFRPYTPPAKDFYTTDAFTQYALEYLEEYKDEEKPFFLYVAYNAPHDPLMAWPEDIARHRGTYLAGWQATRQSRFNRQIEMGLFPADMQLSDPEFGDWDSLGKAQKQQEDLRMAVYAAMVDRMDQNIGKLIDKLTELGELDNTLILFASDNGGSAEVVRIGEGEIGSTTRWSSVKKDWSNVSNTPFRKYKNFSHEGGICTPFIACWPGMIKKQGSIVRQPLHFIDIMATFVEIANAPYPREWKGETVVPLQGTSFLPLLAGADMLQRPDPLFWQWSRGRAIRDGQWKAVSHSDQWQLYDINDDRTELNDLAGTYPERTARMAARWQAWFDGTKMNKDP